ncbi:Oxidoreductase FAD/NAD(P)-binding protein [Macrophomina phaseolina MS6]|uniref:nitric oxide dioxygenase n=1 Tax=Macrophomina phaseolina (strain MS6) TaxID=1126212 RepID=K2RKG1_MACPH|nr:Oxidoreductase FAD/NAD(P)-binding protein [Macrophomina phaseolina MS6]
MDSSAAKAHPGYVSNVLHLSKKEGDVLRVSHPFGDFYFDERAVPQDAPVVFLAAGVGLTCLLAILNSLTAKQSTRPLRWIHAARTTQARAFADHVGNLAREHANLERKLFVSKPADSDVQGRDYDVAGRLDLTLLDKEKDLLVGDKKAQYFVCGPEAFMVDMQKGLKALGVDEERVHLELFGTGGVPKA